MISGSRTVLHLFSVNVRKLSTGTILKSHEASIANQPLIANSAESKIHLENNFYMFIVELLAQNSSAIHVFQTVVECYCKYFLLLLPRTVLDSLSLVPNWPRPSYTAVASCKGKAIWCVG